MNFLKKLASQTAIYGLSSMLGRFINFLLVIPHTKLFHSVDTFGNMSTIFATLAFMNILLTYGMETTYFNFIRQDNSPKKIFSIGQKSIFISTFLFFGLCFLFVPQCAYLLGFPENEEYIYIILIFLVFDTISILPFARLRFEEKPIKFAFVKMVNIIINVALNLFLLTNTPEFLIGFDQVSLVLLANAVASVCSFILLSPIAFDIKYTFDFTLYRKMLKYAWPLIFVGFAGIVNETLDRVLLNRMAINGNYQTGIYSAFYRLSMVMTMFVQAYKFAAEPFFFKQTSNDSKHVYAVTMYWFSGVCAVIFLGCMLFDTWLAHLFIKNKAYFNNPNGLAIVPILLLANLFLGIYYNLSIWYKLSNNTKMGAVIAASGAIVTIVANIIFIPLYGFTACAWITLAVYFLMCVASYILGNRYFKVPYQIFNISAIILLSIGLWQMNLLLTNGLSEFWKVICIKLVLLILLVLIIWVLQPKVKKA